MAASSRGDEPQIAGSTPAPVGLSGSTQLDLRSALTGMGQAPRLAFLLVYFSAATNLLIEFQGGLQPYWLLSAIDQLSFAAARALPVFLAGWALAALPRNRVRRVAHSLLLLVALFLIVASSIDFLAHLYFQQRLTTGVVFVFAETNLAESREFISSYSSGELLLLAVFVGTPFVVARIVARLSIQTGLRAAAMLGFFLLSLIGVYTAWTVGASGYDPGTALLRGVASYRAELAAYHKIENNLQDFQLEGAVSSLTGEEPNIAVLVLGESTNRNHMGLYGYEQQTTPRLSAMADELYVFGDVVSPHSHSIPALQKIFTGSNYEATRKWHEFPILLDLMNAAGYKTYWLSNQEAYGTFGDTPSAIASRADVRIFHNRGSSERQAAGMDGELLGYLERILEGDPAKNKFIVLHLMGTHSRYAERYPREFARFQASDVDPKGRDFLEARHAEIIAQYDNAVAYNDFVVSEVIDRVKRANRSSYVLYFADHGEEVFDARDFMGHTEAIGNRHMVEIPFVLWLSRSYREAHPDRVAAVEQNRASPYMTDDAIHSILDLSSVQFTDHEPSRSIANAAFDARRRRVYSGRDYDREIRPNDSQILIRDHFEKIWAHRVNSLGKLEQLQPIYSGVELDVVLEADSDGSHHFDVNHPPAKSISLSLDTYLSKAVSRGSLRFWLDIKNLDEENWQPTVARLRWLMSKHGLETSRIIVESTKFRALRHLVEAGFDSSYYLPYLTLDEMTVDEREQWATQLADNARLAGVEIISFPGYMREFVSTEIRPRLGEIELLTWFPDRSLANPEDAPFLQEVVNDEAIQVVLIGHRTKFDR